LATRDRASFARAAVARFGRQRYARRELVAVIDGEDPVAGLDSDERAGVRVLRLAGVHSLGHKLNRAAELARGELLAIWDDDDFYAEDRLARQAAVMAEGVQLSGSSAVYFWELERGRWWHYRYGGARPWVAGSTMMLPRAAWQRRGFDDVTIGVDARYLLRQERIVDLVLPRLCVVGIHARNTVSAVGFAPGWRLLGARPPDEVAAQLAGGQAEVAGSPDASLASASADSSIE
jgi:glycosyltransferase involved in cell wall biosynthesis